MVDIAELGLKIDSTQAVSAADDLNKLSAAAKQAETAAGGLQKGAKQASDAMKAQGTAAENAAAAVTRTTIAYGAQIEAAVRSAKEINAANQGIVAHANEINALRDRYAPLAAVQRQYQTELTGINEAVKLGAISEAERTAAVDRANAIYQTQAKAIERSRLATEALGKGAALSSFQMTNLAFQLNDVATMAAMGGDPFRILATQAGQFYQILAMGEGGTRGSLSYLGGLVAGMISPARILGASLAAIGLTATSAFASAVTRAADMEARMSGIGGAAGVTADQIERIAIAAAEAGRTTVGQAREIGLAVASTGKVSADLTAQVIELSRAYQKTFGEDAAAAGERLARSLADPAHGVDELAKRLGSFDDKTRQLIKSLAAQNNLHEAQELLVDGIRRGIVQGTEATTGWERGWNSLTDSMSYYWAQLGREVNKFITGGTLEDQLRRVQNQLFESRNTNPVMRWINQDAIEKQMREASELANQIFERDRANFEKDLNDRAIKAGDFVRRTVEEFGKLQKVRDDIIALDKAVSDPQIIARFDDDTLTAAYKAREILALREIAARKTSVDIAREDYALALKSFAAHTVAQRADLAYQETLTRLQRAGDVDAMTKAEMQRSRVLAEATQQEIRAIEERNFRQNETIERMKLEAELVGKSTAEAAGLRAQWEAIAEAKRQAFERGEDPSFGALEAATENARQYGGEVRGLTLQRDGREMAQGMLTPSQQFEQEIQRLNELRAADAISWETYYGAKSQAEYKAFQATEQVLSTERTMRQQTVSMAVGLLGQFAGKSKAAAVAAIALNKALAIAQIVQDTARASMAAAASAAIGGPAAAAAAAASMQALGAIQIGIVAASGLVEASSVGKSAGSSSSSSGGGASYSGSGNGVSRPSSTSSTVTPTNAQVVPEKQSYTINLIGSRYSREEVRELIRQIEETVGDGTQFNVGYG